MRGIEPPKVTSARNPASRGFAAACCATSSTTSTLNVLSSTSNTRKAVVCPGGLSKLDEYDPEAKPLTVISSYQGRGDAAESSATAAGGRSHAAPATATATAMIRRRARLIYAGPIA